MDMQSATLSVSLLVLGKANEQCIEANKWDLRLDAPDRVKMSLGGVGMSGWISQIELRWNVNQSGWMSLMDRTEHTY